MPEAASIPPRSRWLRYSGVVPALIVAAPVAFAVVNNPSLLQRRHIIGWCVCFLVFLSNYLASSSPLATSRRTLVRVSLLIAQTLAALAANAFIASPFGGISLGGILLVVVAAQLPYHFAPAISVMWIALQSAALAAIYIFIAEWPLPISFTAAAAYTAFQAFSFIAGSSAYRETLARAQLAAVNARLIQAQADLALASAAAERARLWRELHDVLGHHLAALSLHLEAAANLTEGRGRDLVRHARALTRLMLADIRSVMSEPDQPAAPTTHGEFLERFRAIGADLPGLTVSHDIDPVLPALAPDAAHTLLRAAQECVTNTARHASARTLTLHLHRDDGRIVLTARDNGVGAIMPAFGAGLSGMRSRLEQLGGTLAISTSPGAGFEVRAAVPILPRTPDSPAREHAA